MPTTWYHHRMFLRFMAPALVLSLTACESGAELDNLRARSAFELHCPADSIQITNLDDSAETYGVSGCGQRAVYLWHCSDPYDLECKWVLNSASSPSED